MYYSIENKSEESRAIQNNSEKHVPTVQFKDNRSLRAVEVGQNTAQLEKKENLTGMPDDLKEGIESLSGFSMDDVRVHYNSSKPATVQALAYTQGTDIHVAPGQEKHLPHEAWHVAQQMAGRVSPTTNINGMPVNDNVELEHEADVMGEKAVMQKKTIEKSIVQCSSHSSLIIQKFGEVSCCAKITYRLHEDSIPKDISKKKQDKLKENREESYTGKNGVPTNVTDNEINTYFCNHKMRELGTLQAPQNMNANPPGHCAEPRAVYGALNTIVEKNRGNKIIVSEIFLKESSLTERGMEDSKNRTKRELRNVKEGGSPKKLRKYVNSETGTDRTAIEFTLGMGKNIHGRCSTCQQWIPGNVVKDDYMPENPIDC